MESLRPLVDIGRKMDIVFYLVVAALLRSATSTSPAEVSPRTSAWQINLTILHERFQHLYTSGRHSDLTLEFPDDNKTISVHRLMLSVSSPVFEPMLMGPSPVGEELTLQDPLEAFTKLLDYMYLDKMDLSSVDEALRVYATSYKYQVHSANQMCSQMTRDTTCLRTNLDDEKKTEVALVLYTEVENAPEIRQEIMKGQVTAALLKPSMIADPFQVFVATYKAVKALASESMTTRSIYSEIIFNLSPTRNISDALRRFGLGEKDTEVLAVLVDATEEKLEKLDTQIKGKVVDVSSLKDLTNDEAIKKLYKIAEAELGISSLVDAVVSRMACKEFLVL